mmetsp:Transcript_16267/g.45097  ORF Transcript_16267/g.45097 Transcript_16267/m.45097 type:complete len:179 (-) Transcript_16267:851-1387(-)
MEKRRHRAASDSGSAQSSKCTGSSPAIILHRARTPIIISCCEHNVKHGSGVDESNVLRLHRRRWWRRELVFRDVTRCHPGNPIPVVSRSSSSSLQLLPLEREREASGDLSGVGYHRYVGRRCLALVLYLWYYTMHVRSGGSMIAPPRFVQTLSAPLRSTKLGSHSQHAKNRDFDASFL